MISRATLDALVPKYCDSQYVPRRYLFLNVKQIS